MKIEKGSIKISWIVLSIVAIATLVLLSDWIERIGILAFPAGFRHAVVLMIFLLNYILFGRTLALSNYYKVAVALIIIYLFVAYLFVKVSLLHYILGIGFTFLFMFLFILGSNTKTKKEVIIKIFHWLIIVLILMSITSIFEGLIKGTSLRETSTMFREGGALGAALNVGTTLAISLYIITGKKRYLFIAAFFSFGVLLTILKKSIISNFIIWSIYAINTLSLKGRMKFVILMLIVVALGYNIVGKEFNTNVQQNSAYFEGVGATGHVRIVMYLVSFKLAMDYFPFGSGMGTFASIPSLWGDYSNIYYEYGVSNIYELSPRAVASGNHCLFDTYWPHIIGELGFLGFIIFLIIWLFPASSSISVLRKSKLPEIKGMSFYIIVMTIIMTNEGFGLYTPELAPFILFHSGISGLCYFHLSNYKLSLKDSGSIAKNDGINIFKVNADITNK